MQPKQRTLIITTALTYANGPIHLGHLVEAIQADIWKRFHLQNGTPCYYFSGSDAHGTPIMLSAEKNQCTPVEQVERIHKQHALAYQNFHIDFDHFDTTTHAPENEAIAYDFFQKMSAQGDVFQKNITQPFDPEKKQFLADRYIKGQCPTCKQDDQYGDSCDACGATYQPLDLINPKSTLTDSTPITKDSQHYFFKLERHQPELEQWLEKTPLQPQVTNKLKEWLDQGLKSWDISRDAPYFGFKIPGSDDQYFYVWVDAPMGYLACMQKYLATQPNHPLGQDWRSLWDPSSPVEIYHFLGKDIMYFHALFWPAMLTSAGYKKPTGLFTHGFLTINGQKMSKSRGTFITAEQYSAHLNPEHLRYYLACKLNEHIEDIDLNFTDLMQRVNSDLVGKFVNLASRCAKFINKNFNNQLSDRLDRPDEFKAFIKQGDAIIKHYEQRNYGQAMRHIMALADRANQYIDQQKPWQLAKEPSTLAQAQIVCTQGLNLFMLLANYLKPVLPITAKRIEQFLQIPPMSLQEPTPLLGHTIETFQPLMQRIKEDDLAAFKTSQP